MRSWRHNFAVGLALPLLTFSGAEGRGATIAPVLRVSQTSPFLTCPLRDPHEDYTNAEVETRIAADPQPVHLGHRNLVGVWQQDRLAHSYSRGIVAARSEDGGKTWQLSPLPFTACVDANVPWDRASDPWVSIGVDGTVYAVAIVARPPEMTPAGQSTVAVAVTMSRDHGKTWSPIQLLSREEGDKDTMVADPVRRGRAYAVWQAGSGTQLARTGDAGRTWSFPDTILDSGSRQRNIGDQLVVDPRAGTVYDVFDRGLPLGSPGDGNFTFSISVMQSTNAGKTWSRPRRIAQDLSAGGPTPGYIAPRNGRFLPSAAIDRRNGTLYVVWQDARFTGGSVDGIAISTSHDGGHHWSAPHPVDASLPSHRAFNASVAVNSQGVVAVSYYTLPPGLFGPGNSMAQYYVALSRDGGRTFHSHALGGQFDMLTAPPAQAYFIGDYEGLTAAGKPFHPFFVMTNSGDTMNRTDVFTATVRP